MDTQRSRDAFGELLVRRVRDLLVAEAVSRARAVGDDGTAAVASIDAVLASFLSMLEEPTWGEPDAWRFVPVRVLVGDAREDEEPVQDAELVDLAASSDGLVGDLVDWIERFSSFPGMPGFESIHSLPADDLAFRRAVRGVILDLVSGGRTHPALAGIDHLALPPGGAVFPEVRESQSPDGRACWIGAVRLFRDAGGSREPLDRVAWIEVLENPDHSVEARLVNVLEG